MKKAIILLIAAFGLLVIQVPVFAADVSQIQKTSEDINKDEALRQKIEQKEKNPEIEDKLPAPPAAPALPEQKINVKKIDVTGVTWITPKEINAIIAPYQNKEITLRDLQKAADLITDAYRKKGYVTSRAYLPPQKITEGLVEIRVVEGTTGDISVKGNKYFKSNLYTKEIALKRGDPFNYELLRKGLSRTNELPDRNAKAVIAPGKEPGSTDVFLEAKDKLPIHLKLSWDNFGSRYINKNRFTETLTHNNLLGKDDVFSFQYQSAEKQNYYSMFALRYLYPLTNALKLGFFAANSKVNLQKELKLTQNRGKTKAYSIYAVQELINSENVMFNVNLGIDYKDTFNFVSGQINSRDRVRILKTGFGFDSRDKFGRIFVNYDFNYGIPDMWGGMDKKDQLSSRPGAGGKFIKNTLAILRLQKMPFNSLLLWKNELQFSPYTLCSTEEHQIGGIANVRGYPPAEAVGDNGYTMTWEWSVPPYGVSKRIKVPYSKAKLYDALRVVTFYDWGMEQLHRPLVEGAKRTVTLRSIGCGLRLNLPENFSVRAEFAWPLASKKPSDGKHFHPWFSVSKEF